MKNLKKLRILNLFLNKMDISVENKITASFDKLTNLEISLSHSSIRGEIG